MLNLTLMLLVFVVFMALIFYLNFWLYHPILEQMQKRKSLLDEDGSALVGLKAEVEEIKVKAQEVLLQARDQANKIKEEAIKEAQSDYDERFNRARSEIENRFLASQKELRDNQAKFYAELESRVPIFAQAIQKRVDSLGEAK